MNKFSYYITIHFISSNKYYNFYRNSHLVYQTYLKEKKKKKLHDLFISILIIYSLSIFFFKYILVYGCINFFFFFFKIKFVLYIISIEESEFIY